MFNDTFSHSLSEVAVKMMMQTLERGETVYINGTGTSMKPYINSDNTLKVSGLTYVTVGDIVVRLEKPCSLIAHRVIDVRKTDSDHIITTKGDNLSEPDRAIYFNALLGRVVGIS